MSNKVCVPNKTEDFNLSMFNMITGLNKSKTLTKHILFKCKSKLDGWKCNSVKSEIKLNVDAKVKNFIHVKKLYLESCYMRLQKWSIFSKYYWRSSDYVW